MKFLKVSRSRLFIVVLVSLLSTSFLATFIIWQNDLSQTPTILALPKSFVSIEPSGLIQLGFNESRVFTALVNNQGSALSFAWSIEDLSPNLLGVNGSDYLLVTDGNQAVFQFLGSSVDYCLLGVFVNSSSFEGSTTVIIQYVNGESLEFSSEQTALDEIIQVPNNLFSLSSNSNFIVEKNSNGIYQVVNCSNGDVVLSSTKSSVIFHKLSSLQSSLVYVRPGYYDVNSSINVKSNQRFVGYGAILNVISPSIVVGSGAAVFSSNTPVNNSVIEGFIIKLNADSYFNQGIYLNNPYNSVIQNNKIYDAYNRGISLDGVGFSFGGYNNSVLNNYVEKTYANILAETIVIGNQNNSLVSGNFVVGSQHGGITLSGSFGVTVIGNVIRDSDG